MARPRAPCLSAGASLHAWPNETLGIHSVLERYMDLSSQPSSLCRRAGGARPDERGLPSRLADGTLIVHERDMADALMTSIVLKSNVTLMDIVSTRMLGQFGFLAQARAAGAPQPPPICLLGLRSKRAATCIYSRPLKARHEERCSTHAIRLLAHAQPGYGRMCTTHIGRHNRTNR